jgi:NAD(P)-dependent dehydrogenase (short-subunit alcohol dehydrogenase family)
MPSRSLRASAPTSPRRVLVTGGASGLGLALVRALVARGDHVLATDVQTDRPDALPEAAAYLPLDVRSDEAWAAALAHVRETWGGLDLLVNNAGRQQARESIQEVSTEDFDATMKTNIYAPFWIIRAAVPHMPAGAAIIATTSEQATDPSPDLYDYAMTKAATTSYVRSLAKQFAPKGIRVNGVAPGPIWTPLQVSGGAPMEKLEKFGKQTPLGRPGQPAELASIYVQLAAADASYANGQVYGAAGGSGQP